MSTATLKKEEIAAWKWKARKIDRIERLNGKDADCTQLQENRIRWKTDDDFKDHLIFALNYSEPQGAAGGFRVYYPVVSSAQIYRQHLPWSG